MQLNTRYVRRAPNGEESVVIAKTEDEIKYFTDLAAEGYSFTEVKIHKMPEECESCSS